MFDIDDQEDRAVSVLAEDLVDLYIMGFKGVTSGVPADKFFLLTDLNGGRDTLRIMSNMASW